MNSQLCFFGFNFWVCCFLFGKPQFLQLLIHAYHPSRISAKKNAPIITPAIVVYLSYSAAALILWRVSCCRKRTPLLVLFIVSAPF